MKPYLLTFALILFSISGIVSAQIDEETALKIRKYQSKGEIAESEGSLKTAARCFHKIGGLEKETSRKAEWFIREAECWFGAHKTDKAFKAYRELLKNYPLYVPYDIVVPHLRELAERYVDGDGTFWGLRDKSLASDVYELILREAPGIHISLNDRSRLAELYEEQSRWEEAVVVYQEALKRSPQSNDIRMKFVKLLMKLSRRSDGDGARLRAAERQAQTILASQPSDELRAEVEAVLIECRELEAARILELAKFYLGRAQYRREAAEGYLRELSVQYQGTAAAAEGEKIQESLDSQEESK